MVWGVGKGSQVEGRWWARNTPPHVTNNLCRSSHSISELGCSSGVKCAVFRQETPSKELRFLKRKHNSFHGGTRTTFLEVLIEVPDFVTAWKAHVLARNLQYDSFLHTGETCYEAHHCHCFGEPCAVLAKRVNFSASYIDNGIIFENAHALLTTLRFFDQREAPNFLIKHASMAGVVHVLSCVGTSMEPAPAAISGHGASVIGQLKCPCGQVGAVRSVQTTCWDTEGEAEERDRQCKKRRRQ